MPLVPSGTSEDIGNLFWPARRAIGIGKFGSARGRSAYDNGIPPNSAHSICLTFPLRHVRP